jgi:integrase
LGVRQAVARRKVAKDRSGGYPGGQASRVVLSELKTRRSRWVLFLTPALVRALVDHRAAQGVEARESVLWVDHGLVFPSMVGTPVDPDNFAKAFSRLARTAGLGHWHPHEARHSAASVMLAQGVPLEVVSEVLGHSSIAITKDVYGHLTEGMKRAAAEKMAAALGTRRAPAAPSGQFVRQEAFEFGDWDQPSTA